MINDQGIFSLVIISLILTTTSLDNVWILLGKNRCWSPLGLKGLTLHNFIFLVSFALLLPPKQSRCPTNFHLQILGDIWLTEKFAFASDIFQFGGFRVHQKQIAAHEKSKVKVNFKVNTQDHKKKEWTNGGDTWQILGGKSHRLKMHQQCWGNNKDRAITPCKSQSVRILLTHVCRVTK